MHGDLKVIEEEQQNNWRSIREKADKLPLEQAVKFIFNQPCTVLWRNPYQARVGRCDQCGKHASHGLSKCYRCPGNFVYVSNPHDVTIREYFSWENETGWFNNWLRYALKLDDNLSNELRNALAKECYEIKRKPV